MIQPSRLWAKLAGRLVVHWQRKQGILNCPFRDLFEPIPGVKVVETSSVPFPFRASFASELYRRSVSSRLIGSEAMKELIDSKYDFRELNRSPRVHMMTLYRFHSAPGRYLGFVPVTDLRSQVDQVTAGFDANTIGVHIRRTDHAKSIEVSPLDLFETFMDAAIKAEPRTRFYLATDSTSVKERLCARFNGLVMTNFNEPSRNSREGVRDAVLELYALSRTSKLFGSYWSSFSETAAHIGGIKQIVVGRADMVRRKEALGPSRDSTERSFSDSALSS